LHPLGHGPVALGMVRKLDLEDLAVHADGLLSCHSEGVDRSADLCTCEGDGLASLNSHGLCGLIGERNPTRQLTGVRVPDL
jgi:hypothetical protein